MSDAEDEIGQDELGQHEEQELRAPGHQDTDLERIIEKVSTEHGFDVRGYKRSTLYRRIRKRLADARCPSAEDYLVRLETDRHEFPQLINTILINVTEFFRDLPAWDYVQEECLKSLLRRRNPSEPIRAWSVGCATGEEAFSLSMCFAELLGEAGTRQLKIYATDMDEPALAVARTGIYDHDRLQNVSSERLERFFEELPGGRYKVRREARAPVIFGRHNVLVDPPISRLDFLVCRNLLIYFDSQTQQQLLKRFHYALRDERFLFLGKAETLMTRSLLFRPLEPRFRAFQRVPQKGTENAMPGMQRRWEMEGPEPADPAATQSYTLHAVVDQASDPVILLDPSGTILMASQVAREIFQIRDSQIGRSLVELDERSRPISLRLAVEDVRATGRPVRVQDLRFNDRDGRQLSLEMDVRPILDPAGNLLHFLLWGHDRTLERGLIEELHEVREELETTTEELQSTNEELETTNEELQSTNEELETTIEELQSTNEELETANDELQARQDELHTLTHYQTTVLSSLQIGLIVLYRDFEVAGWNRTCEEIWGVREEEALGQQLFSIDAGLPWEALRDPLIQVIHGREKRQVLDVDATNRRGKPIRCRVRIQVLQEPGGATAGAMLLIEELG